MNDQSIIENLPFGVVLMAGAIVDCNRQTCHLLACQRQEIIGRSLLDFSPAEQLGGQSSATALQQHRQTVLSGAELVVPWRCQRKDGGLVDLELAMKAIEIDGQKRLLLSLYDVTKWKHAEEALRDREERFRSIFECSTAGMSILSLQGEHLQVNPAECRFFGYTEEEIMKRTAVSLTHPADRGITQRYFEEMKSGQRKYYDLEKRYLHKDGRVIWGHTTVALVYDANRKPTYIVALVQDITERKTKEGEVIKLNQELEARVDERTRELALANRELEEANKNLAAAYRELDAFSYSVSHDLRAPLRAIDGFSEALLEDYADRLDEEGRTFLRYLQEGTRDMSALIDGLLKLSRSTRGELCRERVDLSALVRTVVAELRQAQAEVPVAVEVADAMHVVADARLLKLVLENLVGNAWKYSSQRVGARVEIGCEDRDGETVFFVKDNGAGFDMAYADKLFLPFHRLHRADEFAGTGIGLATVERIILRHGGRIWADSAPGAGASFYFTLGEDGSDPPVVDAAVPHG